MNQGGNLSSGNLGNNDQFGAELHEEGPRQWEDRLRAVIKQEIHAPVTEVHYLFQHSYEFMHVPKRSVM